MAVNIQLMISKIRIIIIIITINDNARISFLNYESNVTSFKKHFAADHKQLSVVVIYQ